MVPCYATNIEETLRSIHGVNAAGVTVALFFFPIVFSH